jgi:hypothetical protein
VIIDARSNIVAIDQQSLDKSVVDLPLEGGRAFQIHESLAEGKSLVRGGNNRVLPAPA